MKKQMKNDTGITLVALVITIIILLILAGIGITALTQPGLFEKAKESKEITYLKNNDFQIQRTYHIVMHKDKKLLPLYQEIFELIKKKE